MKAIQAVRGMRDITPEESGRWSTIEQLIASVFARYGYSEIRMPLVRQVLCFIVQLVRSPTLLRRKCIPFLIATTSL